MAARNRGFFIFLAPQSGKSNGGVFIRNSTTVEEMTHVFRTVTRATFRPTLDSSRFVHPTGSLGHGRAGFSHALSAEPASDISGPAYFRAYVKRRGAS